MTQKRSRALYEADLQAKQSPYVAYGSALPPVDPDVRDDGSYVPIWKQEVTDERGRKRLHGAFTGGWSAGYFNTVGSKEGWTPSTFISSRANRAKEAPKASQARPEDFMDDEDLADMAEAQQLETSGAFAGLGSTESDPTRRGILMELLRPEGDTKGVQLLKRMGWREGQGVGARVRRAARLHDEDGQEGASEQAEHLFAPENPPMVAFIRKNDHKGLGYQAGAGLRASKTPGEEDSPPPEDENGPIFGTGAAQAKGKLSKKASRTGFGVGVLNDTGSDEEDPYEIGPKISYNKVIGGDKKKKKEKKADTGKSSFGSANPLLAAKPVFISKKMAGSKGLGGFRKCHDGRLPLEGFILATIENDLSTMNLDGKYAPPEIPKDWVSSKQVAPSGTPSTYRSTADAARNSTMDPTSRATMLGEEQLPGKSVFDFLSPAARDRIASASGKTNLPRALGEAPPPGFASTAAEKVRDLMSLVPKLDKEVAVQALGRGIGGWMPYAEDEAKRARYRGFLERMAGLREPSLPERADGQSKDDWIKELQEFTHAAQIFKPMTGLMATRFTSSSSQPKLASDNPGERDATDPLLQKPSGKPEDPAEAAAKVGMYGPMTRSIQQFFPTRLLCKRFNVKPPAHVQLDPGDRMDEGKANMFGGESSAGASRSDQRSSTLPNTKLELVSRDTIYELLRESGGRYQMHGSTSSPAPAESGEEIKPAHREVVDTERNEAIEGERPGDAVFKAIFGSDDEDEDD